MLSKKQIKKALKEKDLKVLKNLGQNFLIDEGVLRKIVNAAELSRNDMVIEIGPGLGTVTKELVKICKKVVAIEKDKKMAELLKKELDKSFYPAYPAKKHAFGMQEKKPERIEKDIKNIEVVNDDILKVNIVDLVKKHFLNEKYKLVSNIPYYITSLIIKLFLESKVQPKLVVLLVQKEVAERICAPKGKLSVLALSVQVYGDPEIVDYVDKSSFFPEPKVNSAILRIKNIRRDFYGDYYKKLFRIIKIGFSSKRKKLANNLSAGLGIGKDGINKMLVKIGANPNARAQELSLEEWKKLIELI